DGGDYREAADLLRAVLGKDRATKNILDSQGYALMRLGESQESIGLFESSLKRYGPDSWDYFNLGHLYQKSGNFPLAIASYREARRLSPQDPEIVHNLGFSLYLSGDYDSALEPFKTAVRLRAGWGLAHFNLAMTYWHLGQYAPALTHARIAEERGMPGAARVVQILSASLVPAQPRTRTVYRKR
ncbi:MAG TPA: tetratricopeptide repeat protein, partial [Acidobacteriota bacterium]|nr:tetratricopeptide repeat protein [Acidobacteriota bacterium]